MNRKVKKKPKLPIKIPTSYDVGMNICQLDGRKSLDSEVTIITYLSNHIPMFTQITSRNKTGIVFLIFLNHKS